MTAIPDVIRLLLDDDRIVRACHCCPLDFVLLFIWDFTTMLAALLKEGEDLTNAIISLGEDLRALIIITNTAPTAFLFIYPYAYH